MNSYAKLGDKVLYYSTRDAEPRVGIICEVHREQGHDTYVNLCVIDSTGSTLGRIDVRLFEQMLFVDIPNPSGSAEDNEHFALWPIEMDARSQE